MWYEFSTLEDFTTWHSGICAELGIPDGVTLAYTSAFEVNGKWIAVVDKAYAEGLTPTDLRLPEINRL